MSACHKAIRFQNIKTRCVLDFGHDGPCRNYAQVLHLNVRQNHPVQGRKVGKHG